MSKKLGTLIKDARTKKGLSQAELASRIDGLSAAALGKAERGESEPSEAVLRLIAKELGVTQTSLVNAMSGKSAKSAGSSTGGKTAAAKTSSSKTAASKTSSAKTTAAKTSSSKTGSSSKGQLTLTATEKKLVELYRKADTDTKKAAMNLLSGKESGLESLLSSLTGGSSSQLASLLGGGKSGNMEDAVNALLSGILGKGQK